MHLGVSTFNWTFKNRKLLNTDINPYVELALPSGDKISYNEKNEKEFVKGSATEFCQVVTQVRNIDDTSLTVFGKTSTTWMKYAQCFAGQPEDPPEEGTRYIQKNKKRPAKSEPFLKYMLSILETNFSSN